MTKREKAYSILTEIIALAKLIPSGDDLKFRPADVAATGVSDTDVIEILKDITDSLPTIFSSLRIEDPRSVTFQYIVIYCVDIKNLEHLKSRYAPDEEEQERVELFPSKIHTPTMNEILSRAEEANRPFLESQLRMMDRRGGRTRRSRKTSYIVDALDLPLAQKNDENIYEKGKCSPILKKAPNKAYYFIRGCLEKTNADYTVDIDVLFEYLLKHNDKYQARFPVKSCSSTDEMWRFLLKTYNNIKADYIKNIPNFLIMDKTTRKKISWMHS